MDAREGKGGDETGLADAAPNLGLLLPLALEDPVLRQQLATAGIDARKALRHLASDRERIYQSAPTLAARVVAQRRDRDVLAERLEEAESSFSASALEFANALVVTLAIIGAVLAFVATFVARTFDGYFPTMAIGGLVAAVVYALRARRKRIGVVERELRVASAREQTAYLRWTRGLAEAGVRESLRELVTSRTDDAFRTTLSVEDPQGLAEIESPELTIPTAARNRLNWLFGAMPGGSIALAGARGAGKTTLMRGFCPTDGAADADRLAVMVPAPVNYGAREYVLHLFAELCRVVLGDTRVAWLRNPDPMRRETRRRWGILLTLAGLMLAQVAVFALAIGLDQIDPGRIEMPGLLPGALLALTSAGLVGMGLSLMRDRAMRRRVLGPQPLAPPSAAPGFEAAWDALQRRAEERLREIWFQQTYSSGWSGSLSPGAGVELGVEGSRELSRHQMSLPDIVRDLRDFVSEMPDGMRVIIGIDELDKMPVDDIGRFLKEIKVIFGMRDCFYLLSISEDALSSFERRGLPLRDVFDSSFDESLYIPPFDAGQTTAMLQSRMLGVPIPFVMLCHCIAGALPRDAIRVARAIVELNAERPGDRGLGDIARAIVTVDVRAKARAGLVRVGQLPADAATRQLVAWLRQLQREELTAAGMLARYRLAHRALSHALGERAEGGEVSEVARLARELAVFCLFAATVLEFFSDDRTPAELEDAYTIAGDARPIDALASARQAFAVSPEAAWERLAAFRAERGLIPVRPAGDPPDEDDPALEPAA